MLDTLFEEHVELARVLALLDDPRAFRAEVRADLLTAAAARGPIETLTPIAAAEGAAMASPATEQTTSILLINGGDRHYRVEWLDFDGEPQPYGDLLPGARRTQHTAPGHVFRLTEVASGESACYRASAQRGLVRLPFER
jgi:hypothetical protein